MRGRWAQIAVVVTLICMVVVIALSVTHRWVTPKTGIAIVVDCGSSGTRAHIYEWVPGSPLTLNETRSTLVNVPVTTSTKVVGQLLTWASTKIPPERYPFIPVFIHATAGVRLLSPANQTEIVEALKSELKRSLFKMYPPEDAVSVLSGEEEGVFGWIAVNFLADRFADAGAAPGKGVFFGAIDVGGASVQITQQEDAPTVGFAIKVAGMDLNLYTHSYVLGLDQSTKAIYGSDPDPCLPSGFNGGYSGEPRGVSECKKRAQELVRNRTSAVTQANVTGVTYNLFSGAWSVFSQVLQVNETLLTGGRMQVSQMMPLAEQFCARNYSELVAMEPPGQLKYAVNGCATSLMLSSLMTQGVGFPFPANQTVSIVDKINGSEAGWALGVALYRAGIIPISSIRFTVTASTINPTRTVFLLFVALFSLAATASLLIACTIAIKRREKSKSEWADFQAFR